MDSILYENRYEITSTGKVFSVNYGNLGFKQELKPAKDKKGYLRVGLSINGKLCTKKVHRLVAILFIDNPCNKPQVNHKNGIKTDNRVENLEWCTAKENVSHAIDNKLFVFSTKESSVNKVIKRGELNGESKLTEKQVLEIRNKFIPRKYTRKMLSKEYNVKESTIKDVVLGKSWKHLL